MLIQTRNLLDTVSQKTYLSNPEVAGTTAIRIVNSSGMTNQWAVQIGDTGEERTEIVLGTIAAVGSLTCGALSFDHPSDTPLYFIKYNQLVFERSTAGTAGTALPLTSGTISIQADSPYTQFDDTSGSTSYAYKTFFRSSALSVNSTESAWITPAGFAFDSLASLRQRGKDRLWNSNYLADPVIDGWINECGEKMTNLAIAVNEDYALGTVDVAFSGVTELGTITATDFKFPRRVWVTYNGRDYFQAAKMAVNAYVPDQQFSSVSPYYYMMGDNVIGIKPDESGGTARLVYYANYAPMSNDDDRLPLSMRSYSHVFVSYIEAKSLAKDNKPAEASSVMNTEVIPGMNQFKSEIAPRGRTGNTYITTNEPISGDDYYSY